MRASDTFSGVIPTYYHPGFAAPIGEHMMPMHKFGMVAEAVAGLKGIDLREPEPVEEEDLLHVHTGEYVDAVITGKPEWLAESQKFPWTPELYPSVCLTSGGCLAAARSAFETGVACALVSGFHHACADHGEGFCTFNGLIVTLDRLFREKKIRRAAILDMDLHYGNGTAQLTALRSHIFALSIYGCDYWENRSYDDVQYRQHSDGVNHRSFALQHGCDEANLTIVMREALPLLLEERKPDLLLYQAGADPYYEDPFSKLRLDHSALRTRDALVFEFAKRHKIPVAWVLAGGYTPDTSKVVEVHVNTFRAAQDVFG